MPRHAFVLLLLACGLVSSGCAPAPAPITDVADGSNPDFAPPPASGGNTSSFGDAGSGSGGGDGSGGGGANAVGSTNDDKPVTQSQGGTELPEVEDDGTADTPEEIAFRIAGELLNFGSNGTFLEFELATDSDEPITFQISGAPGWVSVSPESGELIRSRQVEVAIDRSGLSLGAHSATLTVTTSNDRTEKVYIAVYQPTEPAIPSEAQILTWLRDLQPLQKVHHSWPLPHFLYADGIHPLLEEYVRITHAASTDIEGIQPEEMAAMVEVCNIVNAGNPEIPARISLNYSPYREVFPPDVPPTYSGPEFLEEIELFETRLQRAKDYLDQANAAQGSNVIVDVIFFDSERFRPLPDSNPNAETWNDAIDAKHDLFYNAAKAVFPDALVDWYSRGAIRRCANNDGWCEAPWYTGNELGDTFSAPIYTLPELLITRDTIRLTVAEAAAANVDTVSVWIALGTGYERDPVEFYKWRWEWNYNLYYSWTIGAEMNIRWFGERPERFAPWGEVDYGYFYPEPFGRAPYWPLHFVSYVRGANGNGAMPPVP